MSPVGFEPAFPKIERPQTHALDRSASETDAIEFNTEFLYNYEEYVNLWKVHLHIIQVYLYTHLKLICPYSKNNGHFDM